MNFTVRDMLDLEVLDSLDVVAGHQGLNNKVDNISFLDAPDAVEWIRGSEFIVTTFYLFRDINEQLKLIEFLAAKKVSALGIKLNRFVHGLAPEVIALADKCSLPLISIPYKKAWVDLINPVMAELLNRQLVILEKSNSIRRLFIQEVLEGCKLESFARLLFELTYKPITIVELINKKTVTWPYYFGYHFDFDSLAGLKNISYSSGGTVNSAINDTDGIVVPIEVSKKVEGYIIIWQTKELRESDLVAAEQATTATALYIQQLKAVKEINQRFKDDFLSRMVKEEFPPSYIKEKACEMGWAIGEKNLLVVVRIGDVSNSEGWMKGYRLFKYFRDALEVYTPYELLMGIDEKGSIVFVLPWYSKQQIHKEMIESICDARLKILQHEPDLKLGMGVSSLCASVGSMPQLFNEALTACKVSIALNEACRFEELGAYSLLIELLTFPQTELYIDQLVTPILHYDLANGTELLDTLEVFLKQNCNYRKTAKEIYVHHNTVRYRLEMIEKLLDLDLSKQEVHLNMMLAVKLFNLKKHSLTKKDSQ